MKKYYRSRIMLSGVLSFLIILVIAVAGIWLFSYQRIEENADSFIASELQKTGETGRTHRGLRRTHRQCSGTDPDGGIIPPAFMNC